MNSSFQGIGFGMKPDQVMSVRKHWLWMMVFSTCLFVSCGETNQHPQEPTSPKPEAQAVPARYDREVIHTEEMKDKKDLDPIRFEDIPDSGVDDSNLERFESTDVQPDEFEEIRESEPEKEIHEVQANPPQVENNSAPDTEVTFGESSGSLDTTGETAASSPSPSSHSQITAAKNPDPEEQWEAQFQDIGDSDDFESDSADDFESDSADDFESDSADDFESDSSDDVE